MLPHHYMDTPIDMAGESVAYFSRNPDGRLLVFVHGFMGNKFTTWHKMHEELILEPAVAGCDLVFYGYASVQPQALASAGLLRRFFQDLITLAPAVKAQMPAPRRAMMNPGYSKIVIVAHSLGAAITRRAILDLHQMGAPWTKDVSLLLFAPAHCGAQLAALKKELVQNSGSMWLSGLSTLFAINSQAARDLEPDGEFIKRLKADTAKAIEKASAGYLKARKVIFGLNDSVVLVERFCEDPPEDIWVNHNHTSVCKASSEFRDPIREVLSQLCPPPP
jgi:pimeloyl-ACP methyl ester carboxylesterase